MENGVRIASRVVGLVDVSAVTAEEIVSAAERALSLARISDRMVEWIVDDEVVLMARYARRGQLLEVRDGSAMTAAIGSELKKSILAARADSSVSESVVLRRWVFTAIPAAGWWRWNEEVQLRPPPASAPRPGVLSAPHPLLLEIRIPAFVEHQRRVQRAQEREWEVWLLLALTLQGSVTRYGWRPAHHWVLPLDAFESGVVESIYAQLGYFTASIEPQSDGFSDPESEGLPYLGVVPTSDLLARRGIGSDARLDIPEALPRLLDLLTTAGVLKRERLLRACFWLSDAYAAWEHSISAAHVAIVTAVESLIEQPMTAPCPTCGRDQSPGPTRLFREFIEQHAPGARVESRQALYSLRSSLVHGSVILRADVPQSLFRIDPGRVQQTDLVRDAFDAARRAIIGWALGEPC